MIVFPNNQLLLITPPHTASRNVLVALRDPKNHAPPWYLVQGPVPDSLTIHDHHYCTVHPNHENFAVACVVRHPLDRLIGLHGHWLGVIGDRFPNSPLRDWEFFSSYVAERHLETANLSWMYRWTIADLLRHHGHDPFAVRPLRFETLTADLSTLLATPIILPPRYEESHKEHWSARYDTRLRALVSNWAATDLAAWYTDGLDLEE